MGTDLLPGHQYTDGEFVNGPSLTEHVSEAIIKPTFYSSRTAKDPVVLTDEFLIRDTVADQYRKVTLATLQGLMVGPGGVIQTSYGEYSANSNLTAVIPIDDTIPQNTEGTQIISNSITPKFSTSVILVAFTGQFAASSSQDCAAALFRDAIASAIFAQVVSGGGLNFNQCFAFAFRDTPSTTSAITYNLRVGPASGTIRMNGTTATRLMGGVSRSTLIIQEIKQ